MKPQAYTITAREIEYSENITHTVYFIDFTDGSDWRNSRNIEDIENWKKELEAQGIYEATN